MVYLVDKNECKQTTRNTDRRKAREERNWSPQHHLSSPTTVISSHPHGVVCH
uniref:Uncharacterized protein n=1 Tax=Arion vulgaris TaxID=1028688 RepID=A0A0B7AYJ4_9EUPU